MQIQIIAQDAKNTTNLLVSEYKKPQSPVKFTVQSGQKISVIVDGVTLTGEQTTGSGAVKLVKVGQDLVVENTESSEKLVELTNFYEEKGATLVGDHWAFTDGSQLQQLSDGVQAVTTVPAGVVFETSPVTVEALDALDWSLAAGVVGTAAIVAASGSKDSAVTPDNQPPIDTQPPTAPGVDAISTGDTTPTITGTATLLAGEHLTVIVNGATYSDVAVTAGYWSLDTASAHTGTLGAFTHGQSYNVIATVTDGAGNSTSDSSNNEITFDDQAPTLSSSTPSDSAVRVRADHNLTFTFNEDIAVGTGFITLTDLTDGSNTIQIDVTDTTQVSVQGGVLTLNPTLNLGYGDDYQLLIDAGAIHDLAGNSFAGITNANPLDFKTSLAGQAVISSAEMGGMPFSYDGWTNVSQLINPIQVEDKIYYMVDCDGSNAIIGNMDGLTIDALAQAFFGNADGSLFSDTNRTWAVDNYFQAMLPTIGGTPVAPGSSYLPTSWSIDTPGAKTDPTSNPDYVDMLAIWDAFNGTTTAGTPLGLPTGWQYPLAWSATPIPSMPSLYYLLSETGFSSADGSSGYNNVILQVL